MAGEYTEQPSASMKFPRDKNQYVIIAATGTPDSATMYKARYVNPTTKEEVPVGIKMFNMYKIEDIYSFITQLHEAETFDHENLIKVHCSFTIKDQLWIIMAPPGFSIRSMIQSYFPHGLPGNTVAFILKETLKALHYMHGKNKVHGNIGADCIFLDDKSRVKLAYSSLIYEDHHSNKSLIAPEIMTYYGAAADKATDILMFGLLALELFYGCQILASDFEEFELLVRGIENEFGMLRKGFSNNNIIEKLGFLSCFHKQRKKIPTVLGEVMAACLSRDPERRPTTNHLMEYKLFQKRFTGHRSLPKLIKGYSANR